MKITRGEDIALLFLSELASVYGKRIMPLSEVATKHGISLLFLKKIARSLRQAKLVESKEGTLGGYALARDPRDISLLEVLAPFNDVEFGKSVSSGVCPLLATCLPQHISQRLSQTISESFSHINLVQLGGAL